jgi:hypothetical protein
LDMNAGRSVARDNSNSVMGRQPNVTAWCI